MTPIEPLSKKCIEQTPVHSAAANGHDACVQMLLDNTEDAEVINAKDALGQTPLMHRRLMVKYEGLVTKS